MSEITIGQYFPGKSVIHKMDARMKLVLVIFFIVAMFLCKNFISLAFVVAALAAIIHISKIPFKTIRKSLKPLMMIILLTAIINLFYGTGEPLVKFWIFSITRDGIYRAIFMSFRISILVVAGSMLTYTTSPTELTDAIERLFKPLKYIKIDVHTIAMIMTIALRFIPTLVEEIDKITAAQKSRGADMESGNVMKRIKALIPVIIPLFISSFRRAKELADAMECRCYRGGEGRTKMKVAKLQSRDYIAFVVFAVFVALICYFNTLMVAVV
ncbi:MAG: energy-coupling factor transporter transmembrane protein EcfT [Eubacterium sp.]|nr:energy-coupling factor transporter transmembrane protein EcfT [Eubacterium sp.]